MHTGIFPATCRNDVKTERHRARRFHVFKRTGQNFLFLFIQKRNELENFIIPDPVKPMHWRHGVVDDFTQLFHPLIRIIQEHAILFHEKAWKRFFRQHVFQQTDIAGINRFLPDDFPRVIAILSVQGKIRVK